MNVIIKKRLINKLLITLFVVVSIMFPNDIYNMKKLIFILLIIVNIKHIMIQIFYRKYRWCLFFGFIFPIGLFLYSVLLTSDLLNSFTRSYPAFLILIVIIIDYYYIDYENILLKSIEVLAIIIILIALLDIINIIDVNSGPIRDFIYAHEIGYIGKSCQYPFYYKIFIKSSPLLVFLLFKSFNDSHHILAAMTTVSLILSGTRANILFSIILLIIFYLNNQSLITKCNIIIISIIALVFMLPEFIELFQYIFITKGASSDIVRIGHLQGISELIQNKPSIIITGSGMGSYFYSYGRNAEVNTIELSYIDLWRQMGIFFFILFNIFIISPIFNINNSMYKKMAYMSYLLIAMTNPLLYNSTSFLVYIYMYYRNVTYSKSN
ncbi:MAG: hypothetical protein GX201_11010 [Clostridiales bacterium]|nr:hypothetical protein [Clostridiales bacterium]